MTFEKSKRSTSTQRVHEKHVLLQSQRSMNTSRKSLLQDNYEMPKETYVSLARLFVMTAKYE